MAKTKKPPVQPLTTAPVVKKTKGLWSASNADAFEVLQVLQDVYKLKGFNPPSKKNAETAEKVVAAVYAPTGPLAEYEAPTKQVQWMSRLSAFLKGEHDNLTKKTHGGDDDDEEPSELESYVSEIFPKTKMGKKLKKDRAAQQDADTTSTVLGGWRKTDLSSDDDDSDNDDDDDDDGDDDDPAMTSGDQKKFRRSTGVNKKGGRTSASALDVEDNSEDDGVPSSKKRCGSSALRSKGGGKKPRGGGQTYDDSLSRWLPSEKGVDSSTAVLLKVLMGLASPPGSSVAATATPTPTASSAASAVDEMGKLYVMQASLQESIRAETDPEMKDLLKQQFRELSKRLSS